jgi:hypothetical protein
MRRTLGVACALTVALVVVVAPTTAATAQSLSTLCVGGPGCFLTIQAAVDAAHGGDTVRIGPGTFAGGVTIVKSLNLVGSGADKTTIRGGGPVLTIGTWNSPTQPSAVAIRGVTVTGGVNRTFPDPVNARGGGIFTANGLDADGNPVPGASVTITDSVIAGNRVRPSDTCCGSTPFAGGAGIESHGDLTLINDTVRDNRVGPDASYAGGGGIRQLEGSLTLRHTTVTNNEVVETPPLAVAAWGAGIIVDGCCGSVVIADSDISGNRVSVTSTYPDFSDVTASGAALDFDESHTGPVTVTNTRIAGNSVTAVNPVGDANANSIVYINAGSPLTMRDSVISGNRVTAHGGADVFACVVLDVNSPASIDDTVITDNTVSATATAGDVYAACGAFFAASAEGVLLSDSLVANNRVEVSAGGSATMGGAGISNGGTLTLRNTKVMSNRGSVAAQSGTVHGGGIWNGPVYEGLDPILTLTKSTVAGNGVSGSPGLDVRGGGLFTAVPITLKNSSIKNNTPDQCYGC